MPEERREPGAGDPATGAAVLVGVDGSAAARAALRWADEEAARLGAPLCLVAVVPGRPPAPGTGEPDTAEQEARAALERALDEIGGGRAPRVCRLVRRGRAVPVLLAAAREARLLVLGSPEVRRARDPWSGAVAALVPREADCPVVLVPSAEHRRRRHTPA